MAAAFDSRCAPRLDDRCILAEISKASGAILVSVQPMFQQSPSPVGRTLESSPLDPKLLLQSPRPRIVKMGWPIRVQIIFSLVFSTMFALWFSDASKPLKKGNFAVATVPILLFLVWLVIVCAVLIKDLQDRWILRNGNCVMGRVVDRTKAFTGRRRRALVIYQFAVGPGKPMTARGDDYTNSYSIGSNVLVFFDPERLEKNVALCSTGWRVCDEEGRVIER